MRQAFSTCLDWGCVRVCVCARDVQKQHKRLNPLWAEYISCKSDTNQCSDNCFVFFPTIIDKGRWSGGNGKRCQWYCEKTEYSVGGGSLCCMTGQTRHRLKHTKTQHKILIILSFKQTQTGQEKMALMLQLWSKVKVFYLFSSDLS